MKKSSQAWAGWQAKCDELREKLERSNGLLDAALAGQAKLKETHEEYAKKVEKLHAENTAKLREENADLKRALSEIFPVLHRLLDWRIKSPLA